MSKKLFTTASAAVIAACGFGAVNASAQYGPYTPAPPVTPTLPAPKTNAVSIAKGAVSDIARITRIANRTVAKISVGKAAPGKYTVKITTPSQRKAFAKTSSTIFAGAKTVSGSSVKTLTVNTRSTAKSRKYLKGLKRKQKTYKAVVSLTFKPADGGKSVNTKRSVRLKL